MYPALPYSGALLPLSIHFDKHIQSKKPRKLIKHEKSLLHIQYMPMLSVSNNSEANQAGISRQVHRQTKTKQSARYRRWHEGCGWLLSFAFNDTFRYPLWAVNDTAIHSYSTLISLILTCFIPAVAVVQTRAQAQAQAQSQARVYLDNYEEVSSSSQLEGSFCINEPLLLLILLSLINKLLVQILERARCLEQRGEH